MRDGWYRARDVGSGAVVADRLRSAHTHWSRLRGLLGTSALAAGHGLWIRPCRQVHMFGMRYPIDVAFLDDGLRVVRTVAALQPGCISPKVREATSVLELPAGRLAALGVAEGAHLAIEGGPVPTRGLTRSALSLASAGLLALLALVLVLGSWR